jgi:acylphosphatase
MRLAAFHAQCVPDLVWQIKFLPGTGGWCCLGGTRGFSACMSGVYHATVYFSGRVQGVGFRYQTLQVAKGYEVSGYVMNLPDGRVQLEAEGRPDEVQDFIVAIQERMEGYIRKVEQTETKRAPQFQGFSIR